MEGADEIDVALLENSEDIFDSLIPDANTTESVDVVEKPEVKEE